MRFFFLIFFLFAFSSYGDDQLYKDVSVLIKKKRLDTSHLGLIILKKNQAGKKVVYQLNGQKLFIPASLTKMATLSALYHYYPPNFQFKTSLVSSANIKEGNQLDGDLIFKAGGDPSFTSESLWNLVNSFVRSGIKEIAGDVVIDNSIFKKDIYHLDEYTDRSYTAPANAASFNWNSVTFYIRPSDSVGSLARISIDPENNFVKVVNKVTTRSGKGSSVSLKSINRSSKGETFELRGSISHGSKEVVKYSNIQNPSFWVGHNIIAFLKQRGISVKGGVRIGSCSSCKSYAHFNSKPFTTQSYNMMKFSNNFVARMLTTHLPLRLQKTKGDLSDGIQIVNSYLGKIGLRGYRYVEPSGLSRENRFSPQHFQTILQKDSSQPYRSEILSSYPLSGGVGTLSSRFKNNHVRAKTGLLAGVIGLSGYTQKPGDDQYVFTFLYNGPYKKAGYAKDFFDEVISLLK